MLIGITGHKQAGKNTVANIIQEQYLNVQQYAFADKVKEAAYILDPCVIDSITNVYAKLSYIVDIYGWDVVKQWPVVRQFLQKLGTEVGRNMFGENVWVDALKPQIRDHEGRIVVITDVRFDNEAEQIKELGGNIISVYNNKTYTIDGHSSEAGISDYLIDKQIPNNGTLRLLTVKIKLALSDLGIHV
jgi:hypothetical protein